MPAFSPLRIATLLELASLLALQDCQRGFCTVDRQVYQAHVSTWKRELPGSGWEGSMKKRCVIDSWGLMAALGLLCGLVASPLPVVAGHINCGAMLGPGGTFTLDSNVGPCPNDPALTVVSATLNLNGFTVSGNGGNTCIQVNGTRSTLRGPGSVQSCNRGVVVAGDGRHNVQGVISEFHINNGFLLASNNNRLASSTSRGNTFVGISVGTSQGNVLTENTATDNGVHGFEIVGASHQLGNNMATDNGANGFVILGNNNKIQDNVAMSNGENGIEVEEGATGNRLTGNVGESNNSLGSFDLVDNNPNCDQNRWRENTGTRNQNCIR
jgi:parallel beta-helix repeat protein